MRGHAEHLRQTRIQHVSAAGGITHPLGGDVFRRQQRTAPEAGLDAGFFHFADQALHAGELGVPTHGPPLHAPPPLTSCQPSSMTMYGRFEACEDSEDMNRESAKISSCELLPYA